MVTIDKTVRPALTAHDVAARDLRTAQLRLTHETEMISKCAEWVATSADPNVFARYALSDARARRNYWLHEMSNASARFLATV
jgi:hypothetical protein